MIELISPVQLFPLLPPCQCLSAGSFLEVRESEGQLLRPLAEQLLRCLEEARCQLREQSVSGVQGCPPALRSTLLRYDAVFSQFELR